MSPARSAGTAHHARVLSVQPYLLHRRHRIGMALHKSRHRTSLKACRNQRLQRHNTQAVDIVADVVQPEELGRTKLVRLTSMEQPMSEPLSRAFFMIL